MNDKLKQIFKDKFYEELNKAGISKTAASNRLLDLMEKRADILSTILTSPFKAVPWVLGTGGLIGAATSLLKSKGQRKKYLYSKIIEQKLQSLLEKVKKIEGLEEVYGQ